ncbi:MULTISPECIES: Abi family protein [Bacillaceae]|uniref:Abi family protein n=1 Tax=Bacillaceae TaxID=186817 RepID=UPI002DB909C0|nr:Abi family protein [Bacillus halotolerans]MEC1543725.1 Abi family protein [Bacillus halotolerans]
MKPFKTHRQQISILRDRGLIINDGSKAMRILERENYYGLINGYKQPFLKVDSAGKFLYPDEYKPGVTIEEIYELYSFDRDLRNILLEYILKFETSIKSEVSYRFSQAYKSQNSYLEIKNYSRDASKLKDVLGVMATLSGIISKHGKRRTSIKHYLDQHDGVPLWVLVNYLTFGNIQFFYLCINTSVQNKIVKDYAINFKRDYGNSIHFTPDMLESILKTLNFFRNVCAHEERLYNYTIHNPSKSTGISTALSIPTTLLNQGNLFSAVAALKLVLPKKEHKELLRKLKKIFAFYSAKICSTSMNDILVAMGFDSTWETYFN